MDITTPLETNTSPSITLNKIVELKVLPVIPIPEAMSGAEVADLVAQLYPVAGSRLGAHLVESNIVLTLAGVRGQTEFFITNPTTDDKLKMEELNKVLLSRGISVELDGDTFVSPTSGETTQMVNLESLRGYERGSRLTTIPGVPPFSASEGWDGLRN